MRTLRAVARLLAAILLGAASTVAAALWCAGRSLGPGAPSYASVSLETDLVRWSFAETASPGRWSRSVSAATGSMERRQATVDTLPEQWRDLYDGDVRVADHYLAQVHAGEESLRDRYRDAIWRMPDDAAPHTRAALRTTPIGRCVARNGWGRLPDPPEAPADFAGQAPPIMCEAIAAGWPMPALWGWETRTFRINTTTGETTNVPIDGRGLFAPPSAVRRLTRQGVRLPYLPVWPGFAVDSAIAAALWWMLLTAPGAIKRWRRRRRGLCIACGYDLRGLAEGAACPECGS